MGNHPCENFSQENYSNRRRSELRMALEENEILVNHVCFPITTITRKRKVVPSVSKSKTNTLLDLGPSSFKNSTSKMQKISNCYIENCCSQCLEISTHVCMNKLQLC